MHKVAFFFFLPSSSSCWEVGDSRQEMTVSPLRERERERENSCQETFCAAARVSKIFRQSAISVKYPCQIALFFSFSFSFSSELVFLCMYDQLPGPFNPPLKEKKKNIYIYIFTFI